jgi:hypothetical protein
MDLPWRASRDCFRHSSGAVVGEYGAAVRFGRQGKEQITTDAIEGSGPVTRIVTGGAGNYAGFVGEQRQTLLGFNPTGGVNMRVTFILRHITD